MRISISIICLILFPNASLSRGRRYRPYCVTNKNENNLQNDDSSQNSANTSLQENLLHSSVSEAPLGKDLTQTDNTIVNGNLKYCDRAFLPFQEDNLNSNTQNPMISEQYYFSEYISSYIELPDQCPNTMQYTNPHSVPFVQLEDISNDNVLNVQSSDTMQDPYPPSVPFIQSEEFLNGQCPNTMQYTYPQSVPFVQLEDISNDNVLNVQSSDTMQYPYPPSVPFIQSEEFLNGQCDNTMQHNNPPSVPFVQLKCFTNKHYNISSISQRNSFHNQTMENRQLMSQQTSFNTQESSSNKQSLKLDGDSNIKKTAMEIYKKVRNTFYTKFNEKSIETFYEDQFGTNLSLSHNFCSKYDSLKSKNILKWLDDQFKSYVDALDSKIMESNCNVIVIGYKTLKKEDLTDYELQNLENYILLLHIKLQKYYSSVPELLILGTIRNVSKEYDLLTFLKYLIPFIEYLETKELSTIFYRNIILFFIEEEYSHFQITKKKFDLLEGMSLNYECIHSHSNVFLIFLIYLPPYHRKYILSLIKQKEKRNISEHTSRIFLISCYYLIHRHLLVNVIVQNKNYNTDKIDKFLRKYSIVDHSCIGCMISECFEILATPVI